MSQLLLSCVVKEGTLNLHSEHLHVRCTPNGQKLGLPAEVWIPLTDVVDVQFRSGGFASGGTVKILCAKDDYELLLPYTLLQSGSVSNFVLEAQKQSNTKKGELWAARPKEAIQHQIHELPDFTISQWWGSDIASNASGIERTAIAIDQEQRKLALLEFHRPSNQVRTRLIGGKEIVEVTVEEQGYLQSETTVQTTTQTQVTTSTGSAVGRALVGGVLFGPAGAVVGGSSAKKTEHGTTSGTHQTTHIDVVTRINLKVLIDDTSSPLFVVGFLSAQVAKNTDTYRKAVESAAHWHAVITVLQASGRATAATPVNSPLHDLEKLAELRDRGILTDDEFQGKKKQILGL